jgi:hypothetical protein
MQDIPGIFSNGIEPLIKSHGLTSLSWEDIFNYPPYAIRQYASKY